MCECIVQTADSWLSQAKPMIHTSVHSYFANNSRCFTLTDLRTTIENEQTLRKLKSEVTEHLSVLANVNKVVFFQLIKRYAVEKNANLATLSLSELKLSQLKHNFDQISEILKMTCEEIQETINEKNLNLTSSENLTTVLETFFQEEFRSLANSIFTDPTIKLISAFLESCRQRPQLATMAEFNKEDITLKKAISDLNFVTQTKKNAEFLLDQLYTITNDMLVLNPNDKMLLKFSIKFGFPIPVLALKPIAAIVQSIFVDHGYSTGFWVLVFSEDAKLNENKPIVEFSTSATAKMKVKLRCVNNRVFLCRADCLKLCGETNINVNFYENLMDKMKHLRKYFPDHHNSFREELIKRL